MQLYLVTHQENIFLKSRIKKLTKDKEEAVNNFLSLINEVCQSSDLKLKTYCTNFIVNNKHNILAFDVNADFLKVLQRTSTSTASSSEWLMPKKAVITLTATKSLPTTSVSELPHQDLGIMPLLPEEPKPKLRGLPGEYVWTVKDRNGIIEKLYEYDYGYDFDNGDTIRRIRQYSVYHDNDCLLDFSNSRSTTIFHKPAENMENANIQWGSHFQFPFHRNFLTNSPVFQKFLQNNKNNVVVTRSMSPAPPLLCG
ncbi:uncharacterized protein LOC126367369 isoform X1 [Pectinophora gossypiella]|uniref:uncharacterized protein LOC126367369 isoform X1 n=1 Tax=Pectinophora gossypiella TaxID=13191 RepID=UPI00214EE719|nr:uncharacterized protein LOC126367369 isoform X1 [Pectinophora gossypiella]